jgi:hypothetical protein
MRGSLTTTAFDAFLRGKLPLCTQEAKAAESLGLHVRDELIPSTTSGEAAMHPSKVATAAMALTRLTGLVGELREAHADAHKIAAALAGAVRLAQNGAIDVEDIFDMARRTIADGSVKTATLEDEFDQVPGLIVGEARGAADNDLDVLTRTLRGLRRSG